MYIDFIWLFSIALAYPIDYKILYYLKQCNFYFVCIFVYFQVILCPSTMAVIIHRPTTFPHVLKYNHIIALDTIVYKIILVQAFPKAIFAFSHEIL